MVTLINYITNYATSILLIIFWYYLLATVANLWKQTLLERYVPVPLEQIFFYQMRTLLTDLCLLLLSLEISISMAYSRNLGQRSILAKKALFWKKAPRNFTSPYSIPFLSVLHQSKVLHNFQKRGQHSIVKTQKRSNPYEKINQCLTDINQIFKI